jgi:sirohydrochlorin ferrochelatase
MVSIRFIIRIKILVNKHQVARRVEAERRWRIVLVPVALVARVTIKLRKHCTRKRWRKVRSYLSKMARATLVEASSSKESRGWTQVAKSYRLRTQSAKVRIAIRRLRI